MGNKVHPEGFRIGVTKDWKTHWYAEGRERINNVLEDRKIRLFLEDKLSLAGISKIEIERSISALKVTIFVSRPGVVIGRGGSGTTTLRDELSKITKSKVELSVETVKDYETSAILVAGGICRQIEKRFPYKRAMVGAVEKAMDKGAKGIKITCSGVLSGPSSIGRTETIVRGSVPLQTLRADIDYSQKAAFTTYGNIGVKVWIYKGEVKGKLK
ncbi:30S ribosomal protein S3 [candidate division WWE3 bacterium CG10_big_fil_rev_8_21_14_0_10_39_14]|nr:MAG: 30S ribosomal protein S3 [candidate division WWE3 bacterium CG10_big_fil_rev_8_21_14_0_10_39_14]